MAYEFFKAFRIRVFVGFLRGSHSRGILLLVLFWLEPGLARRLQAKGRGQGRKRLLPWARIHESPRGRKNLSLGKIRKKRLGHGRRLEQAGRGRRDWRIFVERKADLNRAVQLQAARERHRPRRLGTFRRLPFKARAPCGPLLRGQGRRQRLPAVHLERDRLSLHGKKGLPPARPRHKLRLQFRRDKRRKNKDWKKRIFLPDSVASQRIGPLCHRPGI